MRIVLGVMSECSGGSLLSSKDIVASCFASCKRTLACVIPVKVRHSEKDNTISLNSYTPSFFTSKGLGLDGSLSHSSTCCFHNASCSGYLCSSDCVSSLKSAWCSLHSGTASFCSNKTGATAVEGRKHTFDS